MFSSDFMIDITPNLSGGSDKHNKGYFATSTALATAYPTAAEGDYAVVGSTDTIWVWDSSSNAWVDTDTKGQVTSVNNKTGAVNLTAQDVGAVYTGGKNVNVSAQNVISSDQYPLFTVNSGNVNASGEGDLLGTATYDNVSHDYFTAYANHYTRSGNILTQDSNGAPSRVGTDTISSYSASNPWYMIIKAKTTVANTGQIYFGFFINAENPSTRLQLTFSTNSSYRMAYIYINGSAPSYPTHNLTGIDGYLKFEFTGTQYIGSYSTDKVNWTALATVDSTTVASRTDNLVCYFYQEGVEIDVSEFYYVNDGVEVWRAVDSIDTINNLSFKVGNTYPSLTATNGQGEQFTLDTLSNLDLQGATDGNYTTWVTPEGQVYTNKGTTYVQNSAPTMNTGDVWLNTSVYPYKAVQSDGTTECDDVPIGTFTIATQTNGSVLLTNPKTIRYNRFAVTANELSPIAYSGFSTGMLSYPTGGSALTDTTLYNYIKGLYNNGLTITDNSYTNITGTLTITDKGVASGFSGSDYINLKPFAPSGDWEMNVSFMMTSSPTATQPIIGRANGGGYFRLVVTADLKPECGLSTDGNGWNIAEITGDTALSLNTKYNATVRYKSGVYSFYIDDTLIGSATSSSKINTNNNNLLMGMAFTSIRYFDCGVIYLNSFNIKENGVTTFQGKYLTCNVVSTGSKVVDVAYKDCVDEIFNASGSALYYVLDTSNQTVRLPQGDIFGFITQMIERSA